MTLNVLFLCTGNSARSILAETLLNHWGRDRFRAYSAGSFPKGTVHPMAIEVLKQAGMQTAGLRSKSWDEFAQADAPKMNYIITVCDQAAGEVCPIWPGHPVTAHWGLPDPAAEEGTPERQMAAFKNAIGVIASRVRQLLVLDHDAGIQNELKKKLTEIGKIGEEVKS